MFTKVNISLICLAFNCFAQSNVDTTAINNLNEKAFKLVQVSPKDGVKLAREALQLSQNAKHTRGIGKAYLNLGYAAYLQNDFENAIVLYGRSLSYREKLKDLIGIASVYNNLGIVYQSKAELSKALDYYIQSLDLRRRQKDNRAIASSLNNIGNIFERTADFEGATKYYTEALGIYRKLEDLPNTAGTLLNLGNISDEINKPFEAIKYYKEALKVSLQVADSTTVCLIFNNLGEVYRTTSDPIAAREYFLNALNMKKRMGIMQGSASILNNLGLTYKVMNDLSISEIYHEKALAQANITGEREQQLRAFENLSDLALKTGNAVKAYKLRVRFEKLKDSIFNNQSVEKLTAMQSRFDIQNKESEIALLQKDKDISVLALSEKEAQYNKQRVLNLLLIVVVVGIAIVAILILVVANNSRKANKALENKNFEINRQHQALERSTQQIESQKLIVELKNKEITDSIHYALRIQQALLPGNDGLSNTLRGSFILNRPRDIVSGDFYWYHVIQEKILIGLGDCVGHGVPGAFMTVLANTLLREIVVEKEIFEPAIILHQLDTQIESTLNKHTKEADSVGEIDLSFLCIDLKFNTLSFSGARSSLYVIEPNTSLVELKGNKFSIGGTFDFAKVFDQVEVKYATGTMVYLSSDGYKDQFGQDYHNPKKFQSKTFKNLLQEIHKENCTKQLQILNENLLIWQGECSQTDDIMVLGLKL